MNLVIDIGNTQIKVAVFEDTILLYKDQFPHDQIVSKSFPDITNCGDRQELEALKNFKEFLLALSPDSLIVEKYFRKSLFSLSQKIRFIRRDQR